MSERKKKKVLTFIFCMLKEFSNNCMPYIVKSLGGLHTSLVYNQFLQGDGQEQF